MRQGHYAAESTGSAIDPAPDLSLEGIGDLRDCDLSRFLTVTPPPSAAFPRQA